MQLSGKTIIFFNSSKLLERGGAGKMTMFVANVCAAYFKKVYVVLMSNGPRPRDLDERIEFINSPYERSSPMPIWRTKGIKAIRKIVKDIRPDIVCPFVSEMAVMTRIATLGLDVCFCPAERGDPYTETFPWNILVSWAYNNSDYCFFQLEKARDYYGEKVVGKSFVIPNPYLPAKNVEPYKGVRKKTIVSAGRFEKEKCYDDLINAFAKVYSIHPDYSLVLYGDGSLLEQYKKQVESLGLNDVVFFPGYTWDVPNALREEGIFVLPSLYEGIPNTLIDALSVGIPVVSTDCTPGGPYFLTEGGRNGLLVPVNNPEKMADAVNSIVEDTMLAEELSRKGPSILSSISVDRISQMWIEAFGKIAKAKQ